QIFNAMWTTLGVTIVSFIIALLCGIVWAALRRVPFRPFQWLVIFALNFIRSTPPLVQLFFLYFALPVIPYVGITLSPFQTAVIGLGFHFSTYISEVYRSGINDV